METTIDISRLADQIIVIGTFSILLAIFIYLFIDAVITITNEIKAWRIRRKTRKAKKAEEEKKQEPELQ